MKQSKLIEIFLFAPIFVMLWGCYSDNLTREKAETIIKEQLKLPKDEIKPFDVQFETIYFDDTELEQLQTEGFLTYTVSEYGVNSKGVWLDLTEKGKQYAASEIYKKDQDMAMGTDFEKYIKIKVAKLEFGNITGIIKSGSNNAKVDYTIIRKDITPFGRIEFKLKEEVINKSVSLMKYDDGWRVVPEKDEE